MSRKSLTVPALNTLSAWQFSFNVLDPIHPLPIARQVESLVGSVYVFVCLRVHLLDFTHLSFRPPSPPQCGLSDGPTHCCT